jgi:pimeloyl-ACP methyl ester carboxylesterase
MSGLKEVTALFFKRITASVRFGREVPLQRRFFTILFLCGFSFALPNVAITQTSGGTQQVPPPLGKLVDVGGYRVHLYCIGAGSPTVVILGAGYSFDWGLVQPQIAASTQICAYDHSGSAWSDEGPKDSCALRVQEVHAALKNGGIAGPYVLVGHSLGGVIARLYAAQYPDEVAGVVFVDHAFAMINRRPSSGAPATAATTPPPMPPPPPSAPAGKICNTGMTDDPNFSRLPARDIELHRLWALRAQGNPSSLGDLDMLLDCIAEADASIKDQTHPLGDKPLVDVTAGNLPPVPPAMAEKQASRYAELQTKLLSLSSNSKQLTAESSGHFIIIDRPDVVINAIEQVVRSVRNGRKL